MDVRSLRAYPTCHRAARQADLRFQLSGELQVETRNWSLQKRALTLSHETGQRAEGRRGGEGGQARLAFWVPPIPSVPDETPAKVTSRSSWEKENLEGEVRHTEAGLGPAEAQARRGPGLALVEMGGPRVRTRVGSCRGGRRTRGTEPSKTAALKELCSRATDRRAADKGTG